MKYVKGRRSYSMTINNNTTIYRVEKGIVDDAGIVADNDISKTIIVIKKMIYTSNIDN